MKLRPYILLLCLCCLMTGCTIVSCDRAFPTPAWYWSKAAIRCRADREWIRTNQPSATPSSMALPPLPAAVIGSEIVKKHPTARTFSFAWGQVDNAVQYELVWGTISHTYTNGTLSTKPWVQVTNFPISGRIFAACIAFTSGWQNSGLSAEISLSGLGPWLYTIATNGPVETSSSVSGPWSPAMDAFPITWTSDQPGPLPGNHFWRGAVNQTTRLTVIP